VIHADKLILCFNSGRFDSLVKWGTAHCSMHLFRWFFTASDL